MAYQASRRGHWGAWRMLLTVPAMLAGAAVMLVTLGGLGRWEALAFGGWLGCGTATMTRRGERIFVRVGCRFRRPKPAERAVLEPLWAQVLDHCGIAAGSVELYVQRSGAVNAYAVGARSVAVTTHVLDDYGEGTIDRDLVVGVLAHELGHVQTRGAQFVPAAVWWAMPWRLVYRTALRIAIRLTGRQPTLLMWMVAAAVFSVAIIQAVRDGAWNTAVLLSTIVILRTVTPFADAALSRASERAADRFAARAGYGEQLARALRVLDHSSPRRPPLGEVLDDHPAVRKRIADLTVQAPRHGRARAPVAAA